MNDEIFASRIRGIPPRRELDWKRKKVRKHGERRQKARATQTPAKPRKDGQLSKKSGGKKGASPAGVRSQLDSRDE